MKILWLSDTPFTHSAYGTQTANVIPLIKTLGHEIEVLGAGYFGADLTYKGAKVYGSYLAPFGDDVLGEYAKRSKADLIITLKDPHVYDHDALRQLPVPWFPIVPVDSEPLAMANDEPLRYATACISLCPNGDRLLKAAGHETVAIPHSIDTTIFHPPTPEERAAARELFKLSADKFVTLFVGANMTNPSRKNIEPLLRGWKLYHDKHPDSILWLHTLIDADRGGINVTELVRMIGLPSGSLAFTDQFAYFRGLSEARMAQLYWAADALLIPSGGEGFCVPIIEAQACGIPVLATQYTAMRDHVAAGVLLKTDDPGRSGDFYYINNYGGEWFRPTAEAIAQAIPVVRQITEDPKTAETARTFALRFDHQYVREHYWKPGLQRIQTIIEGGLR